MQNFTNRIIAITLLFIPNIATAAEDINICKKHQNHILAPASIMGDHNHSEGQWMFSYRYSFREMSELSSGDSDIPSNYIVTNKANRFFGNPMQPANIRIVPDKMTMQMHMFGAMRGITKNTTASIMIPWQKKTMTAITYSGASGTNILGKFSAKSSGFGDVKISAIYKAYKSQNHYINIKNGISIPTGSIKKRGTMLSYTGENMDMILGYGMQNGSGTWDYLPSITYIYNNNKLSLGSQYNAVIRMENKNSSGYRMGNIHKLDLWSSYQLNKNLSWSFKVTGKKTDKIRGINSQIISPSTMADPTNYGGEVLDLSLGVNYSSNNKKWGKYAIQSELIVPAYQNLNGYQLKKQTGIIISLKKAF